MEDESSVIYGLEFPSRTLAAQKAESEAIRFFVGTQCLRENQIHLVEYDDDINVVNKTVFPFDDEIWALSPSTSRPDVIATICDKVVESRVESRASLWRVPGLETSAGVSAADSQSIGQSGDEGDARLLKLLDLDTSSYGTNPTAVLWHPSGDDKCVTLVDDRVVLSDVGLPSSSSSSPFSSSSSSSSNVASVVAASSANENNSKKSHNLDPRNKLTTGQWNPHHNSTSIATANDNHIRGWDLRSMKPTWTVENAHAQLIRGLDFNPNKQYVLASCGDDCQAKFWDVRKTSSALLVIAQHSHWIWSIKYNNFHDQLLLTSSSDSRVMLHNASSVSSEPAGHSSQSDDDDDDDDDVDLDDSFEASHKSSDPLEDGVLATYEEHEDSVYAVDWSAADPWVFASLSYDGRLVINRVSRNFKYRILL